MEKGRGKGTDTLQTTNDFARKEYIEREAALAFMNEVEPCICHNPDGVVFTAIKDSDMLDYLRSIPTADVAPVRHGRWEKKQYAINWSCSLCGNEPFHCNLEHMNYCPNCGVRMDGDGDA